MSNVNHEYNSTVFALICEDKNNLLEIYNVLNGTSYTNVDDLEITTVKADEGASGIFMRFRNDASFLFNFQLNIYEHQSTVNPNIPLRDLFYVAEQYAAQQQLRT